MALIKSRIARILMWSVVGASVVCGATGAAAVYIGYDKLTGPGSANSQGIACTLVNQTVTSDKDGRWVRRFIATAPADEMTRLATALRVAIAMQKVEPAHLVQVSVVDATGPTNIADLRGRAIGARVTLISGPANPLEVSTGVYSGYTIEGPAGSDGEFHGQRFDIPSDDLAGMAAAISDGSDCQPKAEAPAS